MIKRGMRVVWKPEWRDKGDDKYTFIAVTDEHPIDHGFDVSIVEGALFIRTRSSARADMVESAEPCLPVGVFTFLGLDKEGARVQLRRTLGDRELSVTVETVPRSTFYQLFRRYAKDCTVGSELRSGVEFPS